MSTAGRLSFLCVAVAISTISLCGCSGGGGTGTQAVKAAASGASESPSSSGIQPCKLLSASQVSSVLPDHDGGMVALSGTSLMKGVDAYQCSYTNKSAGLLTVILNIAQNDERFSWIKPSAGSHREHRKVNIGDSGWVYGDDNDLKVEVVKGRTVIDLELMASGARAKSDALIELARIVTGKLP